MPVGGSGNVGGGGGSAGAIRAGRAFVEIFTADGPMKAGLDRAMRKFQAFAAGVRAAGAALVKGGLGVGAVGAGAAASGVAALMPLRNAIESIQDIAKQGSIAKAIGLTAEQFTGIAGVAKSAGEDTREFIESLVTLGKVATEGAAGSGLVAPQFFKDLNLNAKEFVKLRADEQFFTFFEAAQSVEDPLARVRSLMVAFGEDGGKFLLPLLEKTPDELRRLAAGFAISSDDMAKAKAASVAYTTATSAVSRIWQQVVVAVAPSVERIAEQTTVAARAVTAFLADNRELVVASAAVAAALVVAGAGLVGVGAAASAAGVAVNLLGAAGSVALSALGAAAWGAMGAVSLAAAGVGALFSAPVLAAAAAGTLAYLVATKDEAAGVRSALAPVGEVGEAAFVGIKDAAQEASGFLSELGGAVLGGLGNTFARVWEIAGAAAGNIADTFTTAWQSIKLAVEGGDLATAADVGFKAVEVAWREALLAMKAAWLEFKNGLFDVETAADEVFENRVSGWATALGKFAIRASSILPERLGGQSGAEAERNIREFEEKQNQRDKPMRDALAAQQAERRKANADAAKARTDAALAADREKLAAAKAQFAAATVGRQLGPGLMALSGQFGGIGAAAVGAAGGPAGLTPSSDAARKTGETIQRLIDALKDTQKGPGGFPADLPGGERLAARMPTTEQIKAAAARGVFSISGNAAQQLGNGGRQMEKLLQGANAKIDESNIKLDEVITAIIKVLVPTVKLAAPRFG